jgi:hypothetical protein
VRAVCGLVFGAATAEHVSVLLPGGIFVARSKHSRGHGPIQLAVLHKHKTNTAFTVRISPFKQSRVSLDRLSFTYTVTPQEPVDHDKAPATLIDPFDLCEQLIAEMRI